MYVVIARIELVVYGDLMDEAASCTSSSTMSLIFSLNVNTPASLVCVRENRISRVMDGNADVDRSLDCEGARS